MKRQLDPGARVRLTGAFLRSTGQFTGREPRKVWTVQEHPGCKLCADSQFILTDELRATPDDFTDVEYTADPLLKYRHINTANLERAR